MPDWARDPESDFHFVSCRDPVDGVAKIVEIVRERIPARFHLDPIRDIQVLCPMNRGGLGARALNLELQRVLNPPGEGAIQRFGWTFGTGEGDAGRERLRQGGLQRRPGLRPRSRS
jgi:exodeoxyribonuclease V alpha subunit